MEVSSRICRHLAAVMQLHLPVREYVLLRCSACICACKQTCQQAAAGMHCRSLGKPCRLPAEHSKLSKPLAEAIFLHIGLACSDAQLLQALNGLEVLDLHVFCLGSPAAGHQAMQDKQDEGGCRGWQACSCLCTISRAPYTAVPLHAADDKQQLQLLLARLAGAAGLAPRMQLLPQSVV